MRLKWFAGSAMCALTLGMAREGAAQSDPAAARPRPPWTSGGSGGAAAPAVVEGVVVTAPAGAPKAQILLDRRVYSVATDLQATTGTAADVLNQIPSVDVDADGGLTLRGDPNVTVLVDGKPSAQFSGRSRGVSLQQFPAADIERIEVLTNPPAQYRAEGSAGVINIITRKSRRAGLSGTADLSLGDQRRFLAALTGAYNMGKLKLSGSVSVRQDAKEREVTDYRAAPDPVTGALVKSHETIDERFIRLTPSVKLGADYAFNDRQSASLSLSHREQTGKRYFLQQDQSWQQDQSGAATGPPDTVSDRRSDGYEYNIDEEERFSFDQKLWRPDELLGLSFQRTVYRERERYAYLNDYSLPPAPPSRDHLRLSQDLVKLEGGADYTLPMRGGRTLKLGYDIEDDSNRFDNVGDRVDRMTGALINNTNITNHFRYHQQVNAGYLQYGAPFGPWTLQTGVRLEQTNIHWRLIDGDLTGSQSYFRAYPSLNLERKLGSGRDKLTFSLSRRVTRPDAETLNPFVDYQDIYSLRAGNANLLPQDTWSYEFGYVGDIKSLTYGLTAYYRFDRDTAIPVVRPISPTVTLTTIENLPKNKSAGLEFSADGKLGPRLSYALSGNLFYSELNGAELAAGGLRETIGLNAKASLDWRPTPAATAQISFSRTDKRLTPQGYVSAINLVTLGLRHRLWGGLSAVATITDLFDGQRFQRIVSTPTLQDSYNRHVFGRVGYFGLSYTFGLAKRAKSNFEYDPG